MERSSPNCSRSCCRNCAIGRPGFAGHHARRIARRGTDEEEVEHGDGEEHDDALERSRRRNRAMPIVEDPHLTASGGPQPDPLPRSGGGQGRGGRRPRGSARPRLALCRLARHLDPAARERRLLAHSFQASRKPSFTPMPVVTRFLMLQRRSSDIRVRGARAPAAPRPGAAGPWCRAPAASRRVGATAASAKSLSTSGFE